MSVITIWIDENNKAVKQSDIDRQIMLHETPQDEVIVRRTSEKLPNGMAVLKEDNILAYKVAKEPELTKDIKVMEKVASQNKFLRSQAFYSKDRSLTHGEKPIAKFVNIREADPAEVKEAKKNERISG